MLPLLFFSLPTPTERNFYLYQRFEDLEKAHISRKKQDEELELEIYMRRQKQWEEQRKAEKEKERLKAQETIRNGSTEVSKENLLSLNTFFFLFSFCSSSEDWKTTGMSAQDVYAIQRELTRAEKEKQEQENAKSVTEIVVFLHQMLLLP